MNVTSAPTAPLTGQPTSQPASQRQWGDVALPAILGVGGAAWYGRHRWKRQEVTTLNRLVSETPTGQQLMARIAQVRPPATVLLRSNLNGSDGEYDWVNHIIYIHPHPLRKPWQYKAYRPERLKALVHERTHELFENLARQENPAAYPSPPQTIMDAIRHRYRQETGTLSLPPNANSLVEELVAEAMAEKIAAEAKGEAPRSPLISQHLHDWYWNLRDNPVYQQLPAQSARWQQMRPTMVDLLNEPIVNTAEQLARLLR